MTDNNAHSLDTNVLAALISPAPRIKQPSTSHTASRFSVTAFEPRARTGSVLVAGTLTP